MKTGSSVEKTNESGLNQGGCKWPILMLEISYNVTLLEANQPLP